MFKCEFILSDAWLFSITNFFCWIHNSHTVVVIKRDKEYKKKKQSC
jgi:hypothetical protein